jgi:hypothetical protein
MLSLLPIIFATLVGGPVAEHIASIPPVVTHARGASLDALLTATDRRIRALHPNILKLLREGAQRSPTFLSLMQAVDRRDVIVFIEASRELPASLAGRMLIMPSSGGQRFIRVQVRLDTRPMDVIATMAHELRHVLEVAEDQAVRDVDTLEALYKRIGTPVSGGHRYDTTAAQDAGRMVRMELQS